MPAHEYDIYYSDNTQAPPTTMGTIRSTKTISKPNLALDSGEVQDLKKKGENQNLLKLKNQPKIWRIKRMITQIPLPILKIYS